jgi:HPt (histidine-containing phosphotransfer) domain-containing protein
MAAASANVNLMSEETTENNGAVPPVDDERELYLQYAREMSERVDSLLEAHASQDRDQLRRLAHRLKGSAQIYGLGDLAHCAAVLEHGAPHGEMATALRSTVDELIIHCRSAQHTLFQQYGAQ